MKDTIKLLTKKETAIYLGISKASIKNWERHNYLTPVTKNFYSKNEVFLLKKRIKNGEILRLNKRANKKNTSKRFIPDEYIHQQKSLDQINQVCDFIKKKDINLSLALYLLAINIFIKSKDINVGNFNITLFFEKECFKRNSVYKHFKSWFLEIKKDSYNFTDEIINYLLYFNLPEENDILGAIYQSLIYEGKKSNLGSYYTPKKIVDNLVSRNIKHNFKVLDPCCGTGQFLLVFSDFIKNPENIFGYDIDKIAIYIARSNLLLKFNNIDFTPKINYLNFLLVNTNPNILFNDLTVNNINKFDLIATNPPWGAKYKYGELKEIKNNFPEIDGKESFSSFMIQSLRHLKKSGKLAFVLPESITNVKIHKDIRKFLINNTQIIRIETMGKKFKNVFSSVIILELLNKPSNNHSIQILGNEDSYNISQKRFLLNENYCFDIYINPTDEAIFKKVYSIEHKTLKNNAEWVLGIVTGDNSKFLKDKPVLNNEPIYKGADVNPYLLKSPGNFIQFIPAKFQQVAPQEKYRVPEKLIYKFISSNLVFAYDNKQQLTLNSANIVIPKISNYPVKLVLALFNSKLYNYLFKKKFNSIKILRGDLEQLPLPIWGTEKTHEILYLIDQILSGNDVIEKVDNLIFDFFNISDKEKYYINNYLKS